MKLFEPGGCPFFLFLLPLGYKPLVRFAECVGGRLKTIDRYKASATLSDRLLNCGATSEGLHTVLLPVEHLRGRIAWRVLGERP